MSSPVKDSFSVFDAVCAFLVFFVLAGLVILLVSAITGQIAGTP